MSQTSDILAHLEQGHRLTQLDAFYRFNCFRLGARILELKDDGHPIDRRMVEDPETGKWFAEYWMAK